MGQLRNTRASLQQPGHPVGLERGDSIRDRCAPPLELLDAREDSTRIELGDVGAGVQRRSSHDALRPVVNVDASGDVHEFTPQRSLELAFRSLLRAAAGAVTEPGSKKPRDHHQEDQAGE